VNIGVGEIGLVMREFIKKYNKKLHADLGKLSYFLFKKIRHLT